MTTDPVTTEAAAPTPPRPPCTFYLRNGQVFVVDDVDAWDYMPHGIFASGHWSGEESPHDIFIPDGRLEYIDLDYAKLREYITERHG